MSNGQSLFSRIERGRVAKPRRTLVYGTHGIGKSTFGAMAPAPIFIQTEDGLADVECDKFPLASSWGDVVQATSELRTADHEYRTVVTDSLDWLEKLIHAQVCEDKGVRSIEDIGYQAGYKVALDYWRAFLRSMDLLRDRGMEVIFIAHAKIERFENPETEPYDRYSPALHKAAAPIVQEWCDEVLFASHKVMTKKAGEKFGVAKYKAIGNGERILRTVEKPTHLAKRRLVLPDEIELNYETYSNLIREALNPNEEQTHVS